MFFRFFQLREKSEWLAIEDKAGVVEAAEEKGAKRLTVLACSDPSPQDASDRDAIQYKGPLYFDIDCKEDLPSAIESARKLVSRLLEYGVVENCIEVYCSGSKGMHIIVDAKTFSSGRGVQKLPAVYKEMASMLFVPGMDFQVYSAKRGVMWRIPNVQRDDGKYRIRISHEELASLDEPTYRELVSKQRDLKFPEPTPEIAPKLQVLFEECKRRANLRPKTHVIATDSQLKEIKELTPACVQEMVNWRGIEVDRTFNYIALQVAAYIVRAGISDAEADSLISMLAFKGKSSSYTNESQRREHIVGMVQYVKHTESVKFGCGLMRSALHDRPCEGCPIEARGGTPEEEVQECTIVARRDGYYSTSGRYDIRISNFTLEVDSVYLVKPQDGSRPIRQGSTIAIVKNGEKLRSSLFSEAAWASKSGLIHEVAGISNLSFTGSDADVQRIKQIVFANADEAGEIMQVFTAGIHSEVMDGRHVFTYAEPGFSINSMKVTGTHILNSKITSPPYFNTVELCQPGDEDVDETLFHLLSMNKEENMARIIGWFVAAHLKEHFRLIYNQFPLLNVWGNAGSGKSRTLALVSWLNGTDYFSKDTSVNVTDITPWAALEFLSTTTTVPRICEEFNKSKLSQKLYLHLCELFKASWNAETKLRGAIGGKGQAGRTGAVSHSIPVVSPVVVASETSFNMPALLERSVQVFLSKSTRAGRDWHEKHVKTHRMHLRQVGKALMFRALTTKLADVEEMMNLADEIVPEEFDTRPRYSYQVIRVGMMFLLKLLENDLKMPKSAEKLKELLQVYQDDLNRIVEEEGNRAVKTEVDAVIETMGIMAARVSSSSIGGKNVVGLEKGIHFMVAEGVLVIDYLLAHALYKQYSRSSEGLTPAIESTAQFLLLLQQEPYYQKLESAGPTFADGRPVVWLSLAAMAEKGLTTQLFTSGG